jgi:hypothetical protein
MRGVRSNNELKFLMVLHTRVKIAALRNTNGFLNPCADHPEFVGLEQHSFDSSETQCSYPERDARFVHFVLPGRIRRVFPPHGVNMRLTMRGVIAGKIVVLKIDVVGLNFEYAILQ